MEALYAIAKPDIEAGRDVVIEPQHTAAEVSFIREQGGIVLSVDAALETRFERIKKRASAKDHVSFEEFAASQKLEMASADPDKNNLGAAIAAADYTLTNDGTLEALHRQIDDVLEKIKK
jgi:dephospho-CoA kinase